MDLAFIHRHHLLLKTHYFLFFSAFGVIFPILNLTLRSHGLSNTEISFSNIILPFLVFLISPLIGFIADKSRRFLLTFNIIFIIALLTLTALFFLPFIQSHHIQADLHRLEHSKYVLDFCASQEVATKCSSRSECGCVYQAFCRNENEAFNFTFTMNSYDVQKEFNDNQPSQCGINYRIPIDQNQTYDNEKSFKIKCEIICSIPHFCHGLRYGKQVLLIVVYSVLYIIGTSSLSSSSAVGLSIGFASLSQGNIFGKQRVWGTIGYGIIAFLTSRIYEEFHSEYVYVIMFNIVSILTIFVTIFIPIRKVEVNEDKKKKQFDGSALISLLKSIDVWIFLSITFVWGMCFGCMQPVNLIRL
jgi:MFS family permease